MRTIILLLLALAICPLRADADKAILEKIKVLEAVLSSNGSVSAPNVGISTVPPLTAHPGIDPAAAARVTPIFDTSPEAQAKLRELEAKHIPAAVVLASQTQEVKDLQASAAEYRRNRQGSQAQYMETLLKLAHREAVEQGKANAKKYYEHWKSEEQVKLYARWLAEAPVRAAQQQADAATEQAEAMQRLVDEQARQNFILEQQMALEMIKMQQRQRR